MDILWIFQELGLILHAFGGHPLLPAVGRVKAPHHIEVHVLIPRTCDYAASYSQGDFANVI